MCKEKFKDMYSGIRIYLMKQFISNVVLGNLKQYKLMYLPCFFIQTNKQVIILYTQVNRYDWHVSPLYCMMNEQAIGGYKSVINPLLCFLVVSFHILHGCLLLPFSVAAFFWPRPFEERACQRLLLFFIRQRQSRRRRQYILYCRETSTV